MLGDGFILQSLEVIEREGNRELEEILASGWNGVGMVRCLVWLSSVERLEL